MAPTKPLPVPEVIKTKGGRTLFKKAIKKNSTIAGRRRIRKLVRGKLSRRYQFNDNKSAYDACYAIALAGVMKTNSSPLKPVLARREVDEQQSDSIKSKTKYESEVDLTKYPAAQIEAALYNAQHAGRKRIKQEDLDIAEMFRIKMGGSWLD